MNSTMQSNMIFFPGIVLIHFEYSVTDILIDGSIGAGLLSDDREVLKIKKHLQMEVSIIAQSSLC